jgi:hypothetical protein
LVLQIKKGQSAPVWEKDWYSIPGPVSIHD